MKEIEQKAELIHNKIAEEFRKHLANLLAEVQEDWPEVANELDTIGQINLNEYEGFAKLREWAHLQQLSAELMVALGADESADISPQSLGKAILKHRAVEPCDDGIGIMSPIREDD